VKVSRKSQLTYMGAMPEARSWHSPLGDGVGGSKVVIRKASPALSSGEHLSLSDKAMLQQLESD
jgi:hypothetical protein